MVWHKKKCSSKFINSFTRHNMQIKNYVKRTTHCICTCRFLYIASEKLGMTLSMNDRALLVKLFHKNGDSATAALNKFRIVKGLEKGCGLMSPNGLKKIIKKFEDTGSLEVKSGRGWETSC